jgi:adenylate kinase
MNGMGMKLILLGAPGAGKGTQAEILSEKLGIPTISTGNILRAAIQDGTPIGLQAKSYMDAGQLVPDAVIIGVVAQRLEQADCAKGFILDGVPRTLGQAEALDKAGVTFDHVVSIEISDQEIEERMSGRRVCSKCGAPYHVKAKPPKTEGVCDSCGGALVQREDDKAETVRHRLAVYHKETEPLKGYYEGKGILSPVANQATIEGTTQGIMEALGI